MEVHAHTHTQRKKWTHYFWEFLMLFLAVFCGFLAEYKLEHMLEHQRGKQYAGTMLEDLKADKEALESGIKINKILLASIDTLLHLYHPGNSEKKTNASLYYYGYYGLRFWYYVNKQVTLEQMKHSGTIRYFQDHLLEKEMVSLDKMISFIKYWDDRDGLFNEQAINYSSKLFNYTFLETMPLNPEIFESAENDSTKYHDFTQSRELFLKSDPPLVSKKAELLIEFLNFCSLRKPVLKAKIAVYQDALSEIDRVTIELLKQYHLE